MRVRGAGGDIEERSASASGREALDIHAIRDITGRHTERVMGSARSCVCYGKDASQGDFPFQTQHASQAQSAMCMS